MRPFALCASLTLLALTGCDSSEDRLAGVCYCDFASGDEQEYDLTDRTRPEQVTECQRLDGNAEAFGGRCELE